MSHKLGAPLPHHRDAHILIQMNGALWPAASPGSHRWDTPAEHKSNLFPNIIILSTGFSFQLTFTYLTMRHLCKNPYPLLLSLTHFIPLSLPLSRSLVPLPHSFPLRTVALCTTTLHYWCNTYSGQIIQQVTLSRMFDNTDPRGEASDWNRDCDRWLLKKRIWPRTGPLHIKRARLAPKMAVLYLLIKSLLLMLWHQENGHVHSIIITRGGNS